MTNKEKLYCANNLFTEVIDKLTEGFNDFDRILVMSKFICSNTYMKLMDFETRLWAEGVDYIIELYNEEENNDK